MQPASTSMYFPDFGSLVATSTSVLNPVISYFTNPMIVLTLIALAGLAIMLFRRAVLGGASRAFGARRGGRRGRRR